MNSKYQNKYKVFFAFSDLFALNIINLTLLNYMGKFIQGFYIYTVFCIFTNIVWMICSYTTAMYVTNRLLNFRRLIIRTSISFILYGAFIFVFDALASKLIIQPYIYYDLFGFLLFLMFSRLSYIAMLTYLYRTDQYKQKIAFIGSNRHARMLIDHFKLNESSTLIAGVFDDERQTLDPRIPLLGDIKDCIKYAQENKVTDIYATLSPKLYPMLYNLADSAEKSFIRFKFIPDLSDFADDRCHVNFIDDTPVITFRNQPLEDISAQIKKRIFDVVMSSLIVVFILSWLIPILAILIKIDSKGPVFFTQDRSGKNNVPFRVVKLRTLKINPDADRVQVTRNDSRITKLGRFLRKTNLDELPQFFNVLKGDMSIVGSRPHMLQHTQEYSKIHNDYMVRHFTKPGVTGWAQVNGCRGEIKEAGQLINRIEHDIWYMENWNIWLDFKIVYMTIVKTIGGDKNAF